MQPETITLRRSPQFVCKTRVWLSYWGNRKKDPLREGKLTLFTRINAPKSHHSATGTQAQSEIARPVRYKILG